VEVDESVVAAVSFFVSGVVLWHDTMEIIKDKAPKSIDLVILLLCRGEFSQKVKSGYENHYGHF
jgi:hypothetical protein